MLVMTAYTLLGTVGISLVCLIRMLFKHNKPGDPK